MEVLPLNTGNNSRPTIMSVLTQIDPKVAVVLGGLFCITTIVCVGCIVLSGGDMNITRNGFSISHSDKS